MKKFAEKLNKEDLIDFVEGKKDFETINLEMEDSEKNTIKLSDSLKTLSESTKNFEDNFVKGATKGSIARSDSDLAPLVYETFKDLPRRELLDVRFWQWISLNHFENYIWVRWWAAKNSTNRKSWPLKSSGEKIDQLRKKNKDDNEIWSTVVSRFLGGSSMKSLTSRQAISRLFWPYKILGNQELTNLCFEKQDIAVAVFERQYGLHQEAARSFIKNISIKHPNLEKKNIQYEAKKLNRYFATLSTEYLNENDIKKLIME